jgi:hypothetical protein
MRGGVGRVLRGIVSQVTLQINERPSSGARAMIPAAKILQRALFR